MRGVQVPAGAASVVVCVDEEDVGVGSWLRVRLGSGQRDIMQRGIEGGWERLVVRGSRPCYE